MKNKRIFAIVVLVGIVLVFGNLAWAVGQEEKQTQPYGNNTFNLIMCTICIFVTIISIIIGVIMSAKKTRLDCLELIKTIPEKIKDLPINHADVTDETKKFYDEVVAKFQKAKIQIGTKLSRSEWDDLNFNLDCVKNSLERVEFFIKTDIEKAK